MDCNFYETDDLGPRVASYLDKGCQEPLAKVSKTERHQDFMRAAAVNPNDVVLEAKAL